MTGTATLPANSTELAEFLADPAKWPNEMKNKAGLAKFFDDYAAQQASKDPGIDVQVKEQMQNVLREFLVDNRDGATAERHGPGVPVDLTPEQILRGKRTKAGLYNKKATGAALDKETWAAEPSDFFRLIWHNAYKDDPAVVEARSKIRNAMSEKVPADGGFLVPEVLRSNLLRIMLESAIVRPRARVIPMETLRVPYPAVDETSHVSSVFGGITANWTEEGGSITASQPAFSRIVLEAKKLTAYTEIPNELFTDAVAAFSQFVSEMFPEALAWYEDEAFINGSGQGEPQGFLNSPSAIHIDRNTASHVLFTDIATMFPKMLPSSLNRAIWVCSPGVIADLLQLALVSPPGATAGTAVSPPLWLNNYSAVDGPTWQLLGRPLYVSEKMAALGSTGDLAFFDPGYYLLGDRQAMQASTSEHFKFQNDMTAVRVVERLDGRTWVQSAITAKNGTDTISPVVVLDVHT